MNRLDLVSVVVPHGIYDINRDGKKTEMPARACFLHYDAVASWYAIEGQVVISDMYRSADSSLTAVQSGRGAAAPGFSGHNYGLSIDLDVPKTMEMVGVGIKAELDTWMNAHGWWCWTNSGAKPSWKKGDPGWEGWHYNYSPTPVKYIKGNCVAWLGKEILRRHLWLRDSDAKTIQANLKTVRCYSGAIDGKIGPLTRTAIAAFQRTWGLQATGKADLRTVQTLAFVAESSR